MTSSAQSSSPTGYEAFIKDSNETPFNLAKIKDRTPSPVASKTQVEVQAGESEKAEAEESAARAGESWTKSIADGAASASKTIETCSQSAITNYFPAKNPCEEVGCGKVPSLTASSSSGKSDTIKGEKSKSSWVDNMSQCRMDTACGVLDIEFMKKEEDSTAVGNLTENGELLKIEGPPPPKPWTEAIADNVEEAHKTVTKNTKRVLASLGLFKKTDQHLITEYYEVKVPKEPEKSMPEKMQLTMSQTAQNMSTNAHNLGIVGMATLVPDRKEEKKQVQKKITDYDSSRSAAATAASSTETSCVATEAPTTVPEIPDVISIATEVSENEKKSSSWNIWNHFTGFFSKFDIPKVPEEVPSCKETQSACVELQSCPTPKGVGLPSMNAFACNPQKYEDEPTILRNDEKTKIKSETAVEETQNPKEDVAVSNEAVAEKTKEVEVLAESPKAKDLPW